MGVQERPFRREALLNIKTRRKIVWELRLMRLPRYESTPRGLRQQIQSQQNRRQKIADALRKLSSELTTEYREPLEVFAARLSADLFALHAAEIGGLPLDDFRDAGKRGGGSDEGQWKAFYVRRFDAILPPDAPERYALIAELVTRGGIKTTRQYVRAILQKGHT